MRWIGWALVAVVAIAMRPAPTVAGEPGVVEATKVVVRSKAEFGEALEAALHPLLAEAANRSVLLVLDVSPNVRKNRAKLIAGVRGLAERFGGVSTWRLARLGEPAGDEHPDVGSLSAEIGDALGDDTPALSTIGALQETLKRSKVRDTAVVYVNDWRFEDDAELEKLIKDLKRATSALSVVGTEAAFARAWNDGWVSDDERFDLSDPSGMNIRDYYEEIGRSPFAKGDHEAPWHGGDTAYPHAPYRYHVFLWQYEFQEYDFDFAESDVEIPSFEDGKIPFEELERRLKGKGLDPLGKGPGEPEPPSEDASRYFPIPAAYGPYGLMRAAGETGGRYVLWSWNPGGRRQVHYEYSRCNLFPPDLRPRKEILKALRKNLPAAAMISAWNVLEEVPDTVVRHNAPLKKNLRTPRPLDRFPPGASMSFTWDDKGKYREYRRIAGDAVARLDEAAKILDRALEKSPPVPEDALARRYRADAELFRHVIRVVRFEIAEGLADTAKLPKNAWSNGNRIPGVSGRTWIRQGLDPEKVRLTDVTPRDAAEGQEVLAERKRILDHYRGTPFAEIVGLNDVEPLHFTWWDRGGTMPDLGRSPTESTGKPRPGAPGAPSTGGGPTTGK
jgi:hypothetical protein